MFRRILLGISAAALASAGLFVGHAASQQAPDNPAGAENHDAPALRANAGAKKLMVQQQNDALTTSSTSFVQLTADTIPVPATGNFRVVVRFSGESDCNATSWCTLRILVNGVEANPKSGSDFAFDSPGGNAWTSNAIERTSDVIPGGVGSVIVELQWAVVGGGSWRIDDWSASAELWKV